MISREAWLKALEEAKVPVVDDREAITAAEFCAMFGGNHQMALRRLEKLEAAGKAIRTTKRGTRGHVKAWRLVP